MTEEKLKAILTAERIEMLLEQAGIRDDDPNPEEYDAIMEGLDEDKKHQLEVCLDRMAKQEAARDEILYWGGVCDGIRLMRKIRLIENGMGMRQVGNLPLKSG